MKEKRVALITGASSGIGKEIAIQLARSGIHVCINFSRSELKALEVQQQIDKFGGTVILIKADITKEIEVKEMFSLVSLKFGSLDILVNNAGIYVPSRIEDYVEPG